MTCPTCGPTTTEPHPRQPGVLRCVNCKEHLASQGRPGARPAVYPVTRQGRTLIVENTGDPLAICPYCLHPTAGPLAGCDKEECTRREIEIEAQHKRLEDE